MLHTFKKIFTSALILTSLTATACTDPDAPEKCEKIGEKYCEVVTEKCKYDDFDALLGENYFVNECKKNMKEKLECKEAIIVEDEYDTCLKEIDTLEVQFVEAEVGADVQIDQCTYDLPESCVGVIVKW